MFLYKTTPVACCCKAQVNGSCFVMELWDKAERLWTRVKNWKTVRGWHIWKLKLVDARLYFVSMFVGLLTGLVLGHSRLRHVARGENAAYRRGRYSADTRRD